MHTPLDTSAPYNVRRPRPIWDCGAGLPIAICLQGRPSDYAGIDGELHFPKGWQPVHHNLELTSVIDTYTI